MDPQIIFALIDFLKKYLHTFSWSIDDKVGINPDVITHKLKVNPDYSLVKYKWRKFTPERNMIINEKIEKLKQNRFINDVDYLD